MFGNKCTYMQNHEIIFKDLNTTTKNLLFIILDMISLEKYMMPTWTRIISNIWNSPLLNMTMECLRLWKYNLNHFLHNLKDKISKFLCLYLSYVSICLWNVGMEVITLKPLPNRVMNFPRRCFFGVECDGVDIPMNNIIAASSEWHHSKKFS